MSVWFEHRRAAEGIEYVAFNAFLDPGRLMPLFAEAVRSSMEADGLIIDLRGNPGGIGAMAMGMAGWLMDRSGLALGSMTTRDGTLDFVVFPRAETFAGPLAILVDELTASTAEILAGGLQDLGRARVFGGTNAGMRYPPGSRCCPMATRSQFAFAGMFPPVAQLSRPRRRPRRGGDAFPRGVAGGNRSGAGGRRGMDQGAGPPRDDLARRDPMNRELYPAALPGRSRCRNDPGPCHPLLGSGGCGDSEGRVVLDHMAAASGSQEAFDAVEARVSRGRMEIAGTGISGHFSSTSSGAAPAWRVRGPRPGLGSLRHQRAGRAWEVSLAGPRLLEGGERTFALRSAMIDAYHHWREATRPIASQDQVQSRTRRAGSSR